MRNNVRVANGAGELMPTAGATMQQITVSAAAVGIGPLQDATTHVFVSWDGADIWLRVDGGDPVAGSEGHLLGDGGSDLWSRRFAQKARLIRDAGVDATLRVTEMTA